MNEPQELRFMAEQWITPRLIEDASFDVLNDAYVRLRDRVEREADDHRPLRSRAAFVVLTYMIRAEEDAA